MAQPRVLLYARNGKTYGHVSKICTLGGFVKQHMPNASVYVMSGSKYGPLFLPEGVDYFKLPGYTEVIDTGYRTAQDADSVVTRPVLGVDLAEFCYLRSRFIRMVLDEFKPDVVVLEESLMSRNAFGRGDEFKDIIRDYKCKIKFVLGTQGVLDHPDAVAAVPKEEFDFIRDNFDSVAVYNDRRVVDMVTEYPQFAQLEPLLEYLGLIVREPRQDMPLGEPDKKHVLVQVGGGKLTEEILETIVQSYDHLQNRQDVVFHVFTGTYISEEGYRRLEQLAAGKQVHVGKFSEHIPSYLRHANLFVGAGGYNSLAEIVASRRRAIIIPRPWGDLEQEEHAKKLLKLGYVDEVLPLSVHPQELAKKIQEVLAKPLTKSGLVDIDVNGGKNFARFIERITKK